MDNETIIFIRWQTYQKRNDRNDVSGETGIALKATNLYHYGISYR